MPDNASESSDSPTPRNGRRTAVAARGAGGTGNDTYSQGQPRLPSNYGYSAQQDQQYRDSNYDYAGQQQQQYGYHQQDRQRNDGGDTRSQYSHGNGTYRSDQRYDDRYANGRADGYRASPEPPLQQRQVPGQVSHEHGPHADQAQSLNYALNWHNVKTLSS